MKVSVQCFGFKFKFVSSEAAFKSVWCKRGLSKKLDSLLCKGYNEAKYMPFPSWKRKKNKPPQLGCFSRHCKPLSFMPATLPCRNSAFNTRCPDKYFIFFQRGSNNVGWERRKKIYKLLKSLWSQSCQYSNVCRSFINQNGRRAHSCGTAFGKTGTYFYENNINRSAIEWPCCLQFPLETFESAENEFII